MNKPPRIIVHADDFGLNEDTFAATSELLNAGILSSATIMSNLEFTKVAVDFAKHHPECSFGIHLVYVTDDRERSLAPYDEVLGLADRDGKMSSSRTARIRGLLHLVPQSAIVAETRAQIEHLRGLGLTISHADSHGHLHKWGAFRQATKSVLPTLGIHRMRRTFTLYMNRPVASPAYWLSDSMGRDIANTFRTTDEFFMAMSEDYGHWPKWLAKELRPGRTYEIGVHPGHQESWRQQEMDDVLRFADEAKKIGAEFISWNDI